MEVDHKAKHVCKFCSKIFPCGRSLGGHMRSHLINISSTEKKLPPLLPDDDGRRPLHLSQREEINPNKTTKSSTSNKLCKQCGKTFHSWKALFGHMKSHSMIFNQDSITLSSQSHNEAALCIKKRKRSKRYKNKNSSTTSTSSYSNLSLSPSPSLSTIEQEEVALSLILLSMDFTNSTAQSNNTSSFGCNEIEVNSPRNPIKKKGAFGSDHSKKRKEINHEIHHDHPSPDSKFKCIICSKAFSSYQALGGHRASHKKFNGCCAPQTQTEHNSPNIEQCKKVKEHECPICFKVFPSGQALGGHKRSHLISDDQVIKSSDSDDVQISRRVPEVRDFLDLNLPAPAEEDCNEFKPWWIGDSRNHGLLFTSS